MISLIIVVMSQLKLIPTPSWLVYFVLKAQPFFINFCFDQGKLSLHRFIINKFVYW